MPHTGRGGVRQRIPLPQSGRERQGRADCHVAVGETADTLAALELAKEQGAFVFGICNVIGSSIPRATDSGCYIHVGPEIGVASTKAFTGQVTVLAMMALMLGRH